MEVKPLHTIVTNVLSEAGEETVIGLCTVTVPHHVGQGQGSFLRPEA